MPQRPMKLDAQPVRTADPFDIDVERSPTSTPFLSFRYSFTEVSASGGKAHVRSRSTRLENGKLTSESFEGEMDRSAYDRALREAQRSVAAQVARMANVFSMFLPSARKGWFDRD